MRKRYNIFFISRLYLKDYYKFVVDETNISKGTDALKLFMYSMKKLYGLDTIEYCSAIDTYGNKCIERLGETEGTPRNKDGIPFDERVKIVNACEGYAVATDLLTNKSIVNNRLKEG